MKNELIFSGIGGQGIISIGKMLCSAATEKGFVVTLAPAYGQEKRGGRTSCQIVMSEEIGSPVISEADLVLVMDENSLIDYENRVKKDGALVINSSMITRKVSRDDIKVIEVPMNEIALKLGNARTVNMVALGAVLKLNKFIDLESVSEQLGMVMKESIVEINKKALETGYDFID